VLYHLKHPLYALEKVAAVCRDTVFLMSMVRGSKGDFEPAEDYPGDEVKIFDHPDFPRLYFVEKSLNGDESNWWIATKSCLKAMARVSGFPVIEEIDHPEYLICRKGSS
jgi:tRNA (mo5U34)-methyltransferase